MKHISIYTFKTCNKRALLSFVLTLPLLFACQPEGLEWNGKAPAMQFSVSEDLPELDTKAVVAGSSIRDGRRMALSDGFSLKMEETDWLPAPDTKVAPYNKNRSIGSDPIAVWCYLVSGSAYTQYAYTSSPSYPVTVPYDNESGIWRPSPNISFPVNEVSFSSARFYAFAPASDKVATSYPVSNSSSTPFTLTYTVPEAAAEQLDLLVAEPVEREVSLTSTVPLVFSHALTGIRFQVGKGLDVRSVSLSGIYDKGVFDMTARTWGNLQKQDQTYTLGPVGESQDNLVSGTLYDTFHENLTWMMLPQLLPASATLIAVIEDGTTEGRTVTATLPGHTWKAGKLVTYTIFKNDDYRIEVEDGNGTQITALDWDYNGGSIDLTVKSYNDRLIGGATGMPWRALFFDTVEKAVEGLDEDMISCPSWLTVSASQGSGSASGEQLRLTVSEESIQDPESPKIKINQSLKAAAPRGTEAKPFNLSNPSAPATDIIAESANSYIVNAPGWYRLPLVAGNGMRSSGTSSIANTRAFQGHNGNAVPFFKDYLDNSFNDPRLHMSSTMVSEASGEGGATRPKEAFIVWEEALLINGATSAGGWVIPGALTYDAAGDIWWLKFQITAAAIQQGCAVIAVRDNSDRVMWSWLIWVTDYVPKNDNDNYVEEDIIVTRNSAETGRVAFMPRNLGWVDESIREIHPAREVYMRLTQGDAGEAVVLKISRSEGPETIFYGGHGPYFQWGRKDAMIPADATTPGLSNRNIALAGGVLSSEGTLPKLAGTAPVTIGTIIQHPELFYPQASLTNIYVNSNCAIWWNASTDAATMDNVGAVTKTIYDPCPPGYRMPRRNEFEGFTSDIATPGYDAQGNAMGVEFYVHYSGSEASQGKTIFFPATKRRHFDTGVIDQQNLTTGVETGVEGGYWTAIPKSAQMGNRMWFNVAPSSASPRNPLVYVAVPSGNSATTNYSGDIDMHYRQKGTGEAVRPARNVE